MADAARVYAEALFEVGRDKGKLDTLQQQLGEFTDAVDRNHELQVFFFSPYLSSTEKQEGIERAITGAEPELINFLELLVDKHRMTEIFRIRREFEELWKHENRRIDVTVTSAVELDPAVVEKIGQEVERQTGEKVDLSSAVDDRDPRRHRPAGRQHGPGREHPQSPGETSKERRHRGVRRQRAPDGDQARRDRKHPARADRGTGDRFRRPHRGRHGPVRRRRHRPHPRARQLHGAGDARAAARGHRPGAEPRGRQRRRRAVRRLGRDRRGRHGQADRQAARDPGRRGAARPHGRPARPPARRPRRDRHHRDPPGRVQSPRRRPAPAGRGTRPDRADVDRRDDPDRPRPARADHRRPPDRQDGDRDRHDHQQQGQGPDLHLRRDRAADVDGRPAERDAGGKRRDGEHDHRRRPRRRGGADQVHRPLRRLRDGRALPLQRQSRALRLRRPHQTRLRLPADVAAAAAPAGSRGLPGRRLLPALAAAGAGGEAERRARRRLADGAADHRDPGLRRLRLHPDQRDLDHRRPDLPRVRPLLLRRPAGDQRRHLGLPGRR